MGDAHMRRGRDGRLCPIGDAEAGLGQHADIVRPVADGEHRLARKGEALAQLDQRIALGLMAEDRLLDLAGEAAVARDQAVGACSWKPRISAMREVNSVKPPETRQQ